MLSSKLCRNFLCAEVIEGKSWAQKTRGNSFDCVESVPGYSIRFRIYSASAPTFCTFNFYTTKAHVLFFLTYPGLGAQP